MELKVTREGEVLGLLILFFLTPFLIAACCLNVILDAVGYYKDENSYY